MAKIYVSPSTQSNNAYAGGGNERDNMRKVRDYLVPMLQAAGHQTRTGNWTNDIASPVAAANAWGADWYLALHSNAAGRAGVVARGVSMHIHATQSRAKAEQLARALSAEAAKLHPSKSRGVVVSNFYECRVTKMPAVLSENDFHDNSAGASWIRSNHRTIAIWHARAICKLAGGSAALERYLSGSAPAPQPKPAPTPPVTVPGSFVVIVTADVLNVRYAPNTSSRITTTVKKGEAYTIVERTADAKWGKLKSGAGWIHLSYTRPRTTTPAPAPARKSVTEIAREVIAGKWSNGDSRVRQLRAAGYDPAAVQAEVNRQLGAKPAAPARKSVDTIAREVIAGKWGNGTERKRRLTAAGYDYAAVQRRVNQLI